MRALASSVLNGARAAAAAAAAAWRRMVDVCQQKCIANYNEPDMNVGELSCVDRCVAKYVAVHYKVGERLQQESGK